MKASNCYDGGWMLFSHQSLKTLGLPVTFYLVTSSPACRPS